MIEAKERSLPLFVSAGSTVVANTLEERSLLGETTTMVCSVSGGKLAVGDTVTALLSGHFSTTTKPGYLVIRFKIDGYAVLESTQMILPPDCADNPWKLEVAFACQVAGVEGEAVGIRTFSYLYAPQMPLTWVLIQRDPTDIDTTKPHWVDITAQWSVADPKNELICEKAAVDLMHISLSESIHMP